MTDTPERDPIWDETEVTPDDDRRKLTPIEVLDRLQHTAEANFQKLSMQIGMVRYAILTMHDEDDAE